MRNVVAGRRPRGCTTLLMRHPFKAVMIKTLRREIGVKFTTRSNGSSMLSLRAIFSFLEYNDGVSRTLNSICNAYYCWPSWTHGENKKHRWKSKMDSFQYRPLLRYVSVRAKYHVIIPPPAFWIYFLCWGNVRYVANGPSTTKY